MFWGSEDRVDSVLEDDGNDGQDGGTPLNPTETPSRWV
jgi:hypothetical protein